MRGLALALVAVTAAGVPAAAQDPSGDWAGWWARAGDTMAVTLHVRNEGGLRATFDAERLRVSGVPFAEVRVEGCCDVTLVLRGDRTTMTFAGRIDGDRLVGTFGETEEGDGTFSFAPVAPSAASYSEQSVTFGNGRVPLSGTVLMPREYGVPGVVFVHGSGAEGRWASRFLAEQAASHGIAALIFDKRGVGASGGDWRRATIEDLAGDAAAAVAALARLPGVDRVGIHGHSQGGSLAPLIAARADDVAFVVASAASGIPTDSTEIYSILSHILPRAESAEDSAHAREYVEALVDVAYNGRPRATLDAIARRASSRPWYFEPPAPEDPYWTFSPAFAEYRALDWWRDVRVPVLLLYGEADARVPAAESAARIARTLRDAGNDDVAVRIFPGADHAFRMSPGPGGWPLTAPGYVETLVEWLRAR